MRARRAALRAAAVLLAGTVAAGCGIPGTGPVRAGAPASGVPQPGTEARHARLYFVGPYGIRPVTRTVDRALTPQRALDLLLEGPTGAERDRGLFSQVPAWTGRLTATTAPGAVDVSVPVSVADGGLDVSVVSQIACTAAHAEVPGGRPAEEVDVRIHEHGVPPGSGAPWTVRCGPGDNAVPAGGSG
ncbi:hypothetical protein ACFP1Z_04495 [Streptomyces gamaensis]|uniref:GerMN domain-containing protein n=1 Tax=Streptomyces gamaensis TaxID=1763542 RepID=A0ABW0YSA8_9ACTN